MAPEIEGGRKAAEYLLQNNIHISMGHSNATFEEVIDFPNGKIPHFTHLYNAMSSLNHREVGMLGAGLIMKNSKLELICDMFHINKEAIEIAIKNRG